MGVARDFIEEHGGTRKTARTFGFPVSTVHDWWTKDAVPHWRWPQIEAKLKELGKANDQPASV